jgi:cytochrome c oxidase cbb3-type subunit 2
MPGYPWLLENTVDPELVQRKLSVLQTLGDPYTDEEIAGAADAVKGRTEMEALVAYLQGLGLTRSGR